jgi:hypothetical protein
MVKTLLHFVSFLRGGFRVSLSTLLVVACVSGIGLILRGAMALYNLNTKYSGIFDKASK